MFTQNDEPELHIKQKHKWWKKSKKTECGFCKESYKEPVLIVESVELEYGIAAGSAKVIPPDSSGSVKEEWDTGADDNRTIEW